jgi:hypothetical protein
MRRLMMLLCRVKPNYPCNLLPSTYKNCAVSHLEHIDNSKSGLMNICTRKFDEKSDHGSAAVNLSLYAKACMT